VNKTSISLVVENYCISAKNAKNRAMQNSSGLIRAIKNLKIQFDKAFKWKYQQTYFYKNSIPIYISVFYQVTQQPELLILNQAQLFSNI